MAAVTAGIGEQAAGSVYLDDLYATAAGDVEPCGWGHPWETTVETGGRIRPLFGLYRETSVAAEFLAAEHHLRGGGWTESQGTRRHWFEAWQAVGSTSLVSRPAALALGARWYASCDREGNASVVELSGSRAAGVTVVAHPTEQEWHRGAVRWWVSLASGSDENSNAAHSPIPILGLLDTDHRSHPADQAASDLSLHTSQDRLTLHSGATRMGLGARSLGSYWQADNGAPVHKGGPGHLVVWAERGTTELRWQVPGAVDGAAASISGIALLALGALAMVNRRRGFPRISTVPFPHQAQSASL